MALTHYYSCDLITSDGGSLSSDDPAGAPLENTHVVDLSSPLIPLSQMAKYPLLIEMLSSDDPAYSPLQQQV